MIKNIHCQKIQNFCDDTDYNNSKSFGHIAEYITEIEFCARNHNCIVSYYGAIFCFAKNRATAGFALAPAASLASLSPAAGYAALRIPCPCKLAGGRGSMQHLNSRVQNLFQKFSEYLSHLCNCLRKIYLLLPASLEV